MNDNSCFFTFPFLEGQIMFPNFFIVGAPKSGTTSLYHYLDEHPDVYMCPVKEPNYFSYNDITKQNLYYSEKGFGSKDKYESLFRGVTCEKAIGEASVSYLFYNSVPQKIKDTVPEAKIIILLRNPVDRGFSHYLMDSRLGYVDIPFEDIVNKNSTHRLLFLYYQQFIGLGFYFDQVKRYIDVFGENQVRIFIDEDLKSDLSAVIHSVYDFLGIDNNLMPDIKKQYNVYQKPRNTLARHLYSIKPLRQVSRTFIPTGFIDSVRNIFLAKEKKPELSIKTRKFLIELYKEDIQKLSAFIGRELSSWYIVK
jgi:hypothetical protein